jgi:hypothetical protein
VSVELLDRVTAVGGLRHKGHVGLNADESGDPVANERMVVDRENPNRRATARQSASSLSRAGMLEAVSRDHQDRPGALG